jgi:RNA polymerase sigma-70 factor (ECF subfamily)
MAAAYDEAVASDDRELMDRWQGGDAGAGEVLVERYFDQLYRFFQTKLDTEADELVQLTFLACVDAKDRFRGEASFRTFLYAIAKHQLYAFVRKKARTDRQVELDASSIEDLVSTPRTKIARNQDYEQLVGCLRRLPVEQQTLLELHYWSELGMAELAAIFEAPEVTIRSRLHRARNALRELLAAGSVPSASSLEQMDEWARTLSEVGG